MRRARMRTIHAVRFCATNPEDRPLARKSVFATFFLLALVSLYSQAGAQSHSIVPKTFCKNAYSVKSAIDLPRRKSPPLIKVRGRIFFTAESMSIIEADNCPKYCLILHGVEIKDGRVADALRKQLRKVNGGIEQRGLACVLLRRRFVMHFAGPNQGHYDLMNFDIVGISS